ncbi:MAG: YihA family ribosome biogenesis GTP-binding protein [Deltaproteobacteria bacterium]|uniref:Probable GTP-binding protein EngB n=1 Tax=Candidatus Zymogenus saltonus TaxID=2844893 RepID=A0A9D8KF88_9DELT|nr:YihA family ribosome biogenesis GTP-binding protein [Candidatus Zymogenus saltonus]
MKITKAEFIRGATDPGDFLRGPGERPQVAFSGRSNVGKSSLINSIVGRKKLARTSSTPGRTREINFFNINDRLVFVDLPGYGYAKVPAGMRRAWRPMVEKYLTGNEALKLVVVIVDIRRGPEEEELSFLLWLKETNIPSLVVATKADKEKRSKIDGRLIKMAETLECRPDDIVLFSSLKGTGKEKLWSRIREVVGV